MNSAYYIKNGELELKSRDDRFFKSLTEFRSNKSQTTFEKKPIIKNPKKSKITISVETKNFMNKCLGTKNSKVKNYDYYKISATLRTTIRNFVIYNSQSPIAQEFIGCTYEEIRARFEGLFTADMCWENYGPTTWHIDHIRPMISFDLYELEQQKQCCNWANLQPLDARENRVKGAKWDGKI